MPSAPAAPPPLPSLPSFSRGRLALIIAGAFVIFLWNTWQRDFWAPEEPDFAAGAREMAAPDGSLFLPTIAGRPYVEKPPLVYWCGLAFEKALGLDPRVAYRVAPALAAAIGVAVVYLLGRRLFDHRVGTLAAALMATSTLFHRCGSWLLTDMPFAAGFTLAMAGAAALIFEPREPRRGLWSMAAGLALAGLAKSLPLALALFFSVLIAFLLADLGIARGVRAARQMRLGLAALIAVAVSLPWYLMAGARLGWELIRDHFLEHHLERLTDAESHAQSAWYYLGTLPLDFAPWSLFLPLAFFYGYVQFARREVKFCYLWTLLPLAILSLVSSKQGKYLLPIWPALALLVAAGMLETRPRRESLWEDYFGPRLARVLPWVYFAAAAALLVAGAAALGGWAPERWRERGLELLFAREGFGGRAFLVALLGAAALSGSAVIQRRWFAQGRIRYPLLAAAGAMAACLWLSTWLYADLDAVKSARPFALEIERVAAGRPLAVYGQPRASIVYYLPWPLRQTDVLQPLAPAGGPSEDARRLEEWLRLGPGRFLLIKDDDRKDLESNFPRFATLYREAASGQVGSRRKYFLLEPTAAKSP